MIAMSPGHFELKKGAGQDGFYEYPETLAWCYIILARLKEKAIPGMLVPAESLSAKVKFINTAFEQGRIKAAIEIHFNSSSSRSGKGSECLYSPGSVAGKQLATIVQGSLGTIMPPNRGVKEGWYRMDRPGIIDYDGDVEGDERPDYFLRATDCPAVIIEPEFIQRRQVIHDMKYIACETITDNIILWLERNGHV